MSFFPRSSIDQGFYPLFRLLDDFDSYSRQQDSPVHKRVSRLPAFEPKFDIRETQDAYELHGELPGLKKEDVVIEFTDDNTLTIRGRVERSYTSGTPPAGLLDGGKKPEAITEAGEKRPPPPTVEDEAEAEKSTSTEVTKSGEQPQKKPAETSKLWISERSIGEFSRSFSFPLKTQNDAVSATLKDGILSITIPKAKEVESRRIAVN